MVKDLYSSYKDLPVWLYQIQTKYRDEARPRAGLLRGREFVMKDSYSFDVDRRGPGGSPTRRTATAYIKIFDRLGFDYVIVKATSGAMGGSKSEEFLATAENGEDTYVRCTHLRLRRQRRGRAGPAPRSRSRTTTRPPRTPSRRPDTPTIETLVDHLNEKFPRDDRPWTAGDTLKNVLVVLKHPDGTREPLAIGLPGDREVDEKRLEGQLEPTEVEPFDEADFAKHPSLAKGYIGPGVLGEKNESGIRYLVDPRVVEGTRWVTGADVVRHATCSTWSPAATSRPTAPSRPPRSATATPARTATTARCTPPAASRWATSSSSAASTPTRSACRCSTRTASSSRSPWAPTASASRAPSPRSPRTPTTSSGLVWPREVAPGRRAPGRRPARTTRVFDAADAARRSS